MYEGMDAKKIMAPLHLVDSKLGTGLGMLALTERHLEQVGIQPLRTAPTRVQGFEFNSLPCLYGTKYGFIEFRRVDDFEGPPPWRPSAFSGSDQQIQKRNQKCKQLQAANNLQK